MPLLTLLIVFSFQTNYTKVSKVLCLTLQFLQSYLSNFFDCSEDRNIYKWPCSPIPHCVLSAMHCHRQQSQTPAGTELNSCVACLALFIAGWPRKLKGCLGEGVDRRHLKPPAITILTKYWSSVNFYRLCQLSWCNVAMTCVFVTVTVTAGQERFETITRQCYVMYDM